MDSLHQYSGPARAAASVASTAYLVPTEKRESAIDIVAKNFEKDKAMVRAAMDGLAVGNFVAEGRDLLGPVMNVIPGGNVLAPALQPNAPQIQVSQPIKKLTYATEMGTTMIVSFLMHHATPQKYIRASVKSIYDLFGLGQEKKTDDQVTPDQAALAEKLQSKEGNYSEHAVTQLLIWLGGAVISAKVTVPLMENLRHLPYVFLK